MQVSESGSRIDGCREGYGAALERTIPTLSDRIDEFKLYSLELITQKAKMIESECEP